MGFAKTWAFALSLLLAASAGAASPASAASSRKKDEKPKPGAVAKPAPPAPAPAPPPSTLTEREWFAKASAHHKLGEYADAIAAYKEAYNLKRHPVYLYNIALCNRLGGDHVEALAWYRRFLDEDFSSSLRGEAERRVVELEKLVAASAAAKTSLPIRPSTTGKGLTPRRDDATATVSPALTAPPPPRSGSTGLAIGLAFAGGALAAGAAVVAVILLTGKSPVDRTADSYPGTVIDHRGTE